MRYCRFMLYNLQVFYCFWSNLMTNFREEILKKIALTPKGEKREKLLQDENIRNCVLSSGANVTIYTGYIKQNAKNVIDEINCGEKQCSIVFSVIIGLHGGLITLIEAP